MNVAVQIGLADPEGFWSRLLPANPALRERVLILGVALLVAGAVVTGLMLRRGHKHRRARRHHPSHRAAAGLAELKRMVHEKPRRRHRREHRPRNPTLAETGGLPPLRAGAPPGPPPGTESP